jgi:hypothetical protein
MTASRGAAGELSFFLTEGLQLKKHLRFLLFFFAFAVAAYAPRSKTPSLSLS